MKLDKPTHRCKICSAEWRLEDGSWSLIAGGGWTNMNVHVENSVLKCCTQVVEPIPFEEQELSLLDKILGLFVERR